MNLPELPRVLDKKETKFSLQFRKWIEEKRPVNSACELKQTTTNSLPFSAISDKQIKYLLSISGPIGALVRVIGLNGEPDYIWCKNMPSYIFIKYPKGFYGITIGTFLLEKKRSKRRSLTEGRAREIAVFSYPQ